MKKLICLFFSFACHFICLAQQKSNPTIYMDGLLGYAGGSSKGWTLGGSFNVQNKKDLYTFRVLSVNELYNNDSNLAPLVIIFPYLIDFVGLTFLIPSLILTIYYNYLCFKNLKKDGVYNSVSTSTINLFYFSFIYHLLKTMNNF